MFYRAGFFSPTVFFSKFQLVITGLWLLQGLLLLAAAISDARRLIIPNSICIALVSLFAFRAIVNGTPGPFPLDHVLLALTAFGLGAGLFFARLWGAGDVKFLAATMLWLEWHDAGRFLLIMFLTGGALACIRLIAIRHKGDWQLARTSMIPYGCAIAFAAGEHWFRALPL